MDRLTTAIFAFLPAALYGCGAVEDILDLRPPTFFHLGDCTVVLDWTGGDSPIWTGAGDLPPIDLAEFELAWSGHRQTLADAGGFREMVRAEVESVLAGSGLRVTVEEGERRHGATVVHFSQVTDPDDDVSVGRGHLDTCNISHQDYSIVYAAKFLEERSRLDLDEWVRVFANVAAHEIAHNLGFNHVDPDDVPESEFAELMLARQTIFQRVREQRIIVEQDTCVVFDGAAKAITDMDRDGRPTRPAEGTR